MAFTKITASGIGSTETVTLDGLSVINDGSFGGNLSVGGTLTYEDVTNIDSVGLITARAGVVVGSGITLSKDGDGFYTGVVTATTFSGAFSGDGSALTGVANTDVIFTDKLSLPDSAAGSINVGLGSDLQIYHDSNNSYINDAGNGSLFVQSSGTGVYFQVIGGSNRMADFNVGGDVKLYHNAAQKLATSASGVTVTGSTTTGTAVVGSAVTISSDGIDAVGVAITAANINGGQIGRRNKIINGGMRINQRQGDAAVSFSANSVPSVDRWHCDMSSDGSANIQRSDDYPAGSGTDKSLLVTITSADSSIAAAQYMYIRQIIEGNDMADAAFGLSSAKTCTLSFWVKCSVTGTFGGSLWNNSFNRSYPYNYTINSANTWEKKVIVIPGDTSGTWLTTNGRGINIGWAFGIGSNYVGTANQWNGAGDLAPTSHVNMLATNGATWRITAVQFEIGDQPTPFESRPRGEELALCQRYFETSYPTGYTAGHNFNDVYPFNTSKPVAQNYIASDDTLTSVSYSFMVNKRASPTVTIYSAKTGASGNAWTYKGTGGTDLNVALNVIQTREQQMMLGCTLGAVNQANEMYFHYTAESEL